MAEAYVKPPKVDPSEPKDEDLPEASTVGEQAPEKSTDGENPSPLFTDGDEAPATSANGEAAAGDKGIEAPKPTNEGGEEEKHIEEKHAEPVTGEGGSAGPSGAAAPESEGVKTALEAPLPPEFTSAELIEQRKVENGRLYACCFTLCCCPLCYESYEYILQYICCQRKN